MAKGGIIGGMRKKEQMGYSVDDIKRALIHSCINFDAKYFKPFQYSEKVKYDAISKKAFYRFFKRMIATAEYSSIGPLTLRIEQPAYEDPEKQHYCFYDVAHVYSRLTIIVVESEDSIWIDVAPF